MTHIGYLVAGWSITVAAVGVYAGWVLMRGRALSRKVPKNRRRWMAPEER